jgi:hypothetical protein
VGGGGGGLSGALFSLTKKKSALFLSGALFYRTPLLVSILISVSSRAPTHLPCNCSAHLGFVAPLHPRSRARRAMPWIEHHSAEHNAPYWHDSEVRSNAGRHDSAAHGRDTIP